MPNLFDDIPLYVTSVNGTTNRDNSSAFIATVVEIIKDDFVNTILEFFPNCSYEQCVIRCQYDDNLSEDKDCKIHYEYISKCAWYKVNL